MRFVIFFFGGGWAFFAGVAMLIAAFAVGLIPRRVAKRVAAVSAILALAVIAVSATPLPWVFYLLAFACTMAWIVALEFDSAIANRWRYVLTWSLAILWIASAGYETMWVISPSLKPSANQKVYLLGDSIAAGLTEDRTRNWPELLATAHGIDIADYSTAGARTRDILKRVETFELGDGIVIVEIGGNDLLGSTTDAELEADLDQLLGKIAKPGRQVIMFELPLPPFRNSVGRIQRRLATKYGARLIPKRVLASALAGDNATIDSLHLTSHGHERLADAVWEMIGGAFDDTPTPSPPPPIPNP